MKRTKSQWILAIVTLTLALIMLVVGGVGTLMRGGGAAQSGLMNMRAYAVMRTAVSGIIDAEALAAKKAARDFADANNYSRNAKAAHASEEERKARTAAEAKFDWLAQAETGELVAAIDSLELAQEAFFAREAEEKAEYGRRMAAIGAQVESLRNGLETSLSEIMAETEVEAGAVGLDAALARMGGLPAEYAALPDADRKIYDLQLKGLMGEIVAALSVTDEEAVDEEALEQAPQVDYAAFVPSEALNARKADIHGAYQSMWAQLQRIIPDLTEEMGEDREAPILKVTAQGGAAFDSRYNRYAAAGGEAALAGSEKILMSVAHLGDDLLIVGLGLALFALVALFYQALVKKLGMPRLVILLFFALLCVMAALYGINVSSMLGNVLKRMGMYGVLALAILPGIQCGISLNMGMTVGIVGGLLSTLIVMEANMSGWPAFALAVALGCLIAIPIGWAYSKLLNRLKGNEMTVSTYVGFSFVSLMSIAWMLLPFRNPKLTWALGSGLRVMHNMESSFGSILNRLWAFRLFGATIPTGLILFFLLCCAGMWLFSRSKTGTAMIAAGSNPRFAEAAGINVNRMRTIGTTISTVIAAVGIIVYAQSFGFMQLYAGPRQMGFIAASAILIGGATVSRAKVSHVIIGTFLFQGVLAMGIQVANAAISEGGLSEVMRILISNGIILYALTQSGGEGRE